MKQLASDVSHRSLVTLGIASIQGVAVASFEKEDADRLLFFWRQQRKECHIFECFLPLPALSSPARKQRSRPSETDLDGSDASSHIVEIDGSVFLKYDGDSLKKVGSCEGIPSTYKRFKIATMKPIPRSRQHQILPFSGVDKDMNDGSQAKVNLQNVPSTKHNTIRTPLVHRKSVSNSFRRQQNIPLNPLPLKKHGCNRSPVQDCSEVSFCTLCGLE